MLEIEDLVFEYENEKPIINHLNLSIKKGSYVSILGQNGCGKSTLAKLIIGLLQSKSGKIYVDKQLLNSENIYEIRKKVGIVFQNPDNQFIGSTVRDDIAFGLENLCIDPHLMDQMIEEYAYKVNMHEFLDHEPTKLSGGQKQRVALAGILAMKPELIILDEATSMLDPRGKKEINEFILRLKQETNMTIISITHHVEEAALSDQVIVLDKGQVVLNGKPEEVFKEKEILHSLNLEIPFTYQLIDELNKYHEKYSYTLDQEKLVKELWQSHLNK